MQLPQTGRTTLAHETGTLEGGEGNHNHNHTRQAQATRDGGKEMDVGSPHKGRRRWDTNEPHRSVEKPCRQWTTTNGQTVTERLNKLEGLRIRG